MAKKTTRKASAAIQVAAARVGEDAPELTVGGPQLQLDINIGIQDLVDVRMNEAEEQLLLEKHAADQRLAEAHAAWKASTDLLKKQARMLADDEGIDETAAELVRKLAEFTGAKHTAVVVKVGADAHTYQRSHTKEEQEQEKQKNAPEADIDKAAVIGEVRILDGHDDIVARRHVSLPFTAAMKETVGEIEQKAQAVKAAQAAMDEIDSKFTDLPRLAKRAKNEVVKFYSRTNKSTRVLLDTVLQTPVKALPG